MKLIGMAKFILAFSMVALVANAQEQGEEPGDIFETEQEHAVLEPVPRVLTFDELVEIQSFQEPKLGDNEKNAILDKYRYLDPKSLVPAKLLAEAVVAFDVNMAMFPNKNYVTVMDYAPHSRNHRLFIVNMVTGEVLRLHAAHGTGSDPGASGFAKKFGNKSGSNMSSLGFIRTGETYQGKHGLSLRMDGLSAGNSNMRGRAVVIHGAQYVWEQNVKQGRSWGCIAVSMKAYKLVIGMLKNGSLIYSGRSAQ